MSLSRLMRRSRPRVGAALAAAGALALLLSGCTGDAPAPSPSPSADAAEPIFASDEEALAAAVKAYELYREASAEISARGGEDAESIRPFVTPNHAETMLNEFAALQEAGLRLVGTTSMGTSSLAEVSQTEGVAEVSIYLCRDVGEARVFDAESVDVTPVDRDDRTPLQAFLMSAEKGSPVLVVDEVIVWSGADFC